MLAHFDTVHRRDKRTDGIDIIIIITIIVIYKVPVCRGTSVALLDSSNHADNSE